MDGFKLIYQEILIFLLIFFKVSLNPVQIFNAGAEEEKAETARLVGIL
jgi:hypothetical protein